MKSTFVLIMDLNHIYIKNLSRKLKSFFKRKFNPKKYQINSNYSNNLMHAKKPFLRILILFLKSIFEQLSNFLGPPFLII